MSETPKEIVEHAYDRISDWYLQWVEGQQNSPREIYTRKLLNNTPTSPPAILDLGCGPGVPVLRMLIDGGATVVANDISAKQIELAKTRYPQARFIAGDMAALSFKPATFDGVVCFFTLFHLPRAEQESFLSSIYSWLKPGGIFVFNLATVDEEEIHGEMLGHGMFWSSYAVDKSEAMVKDVGFKVLETELLESEPDDGVEFLWIMAKKLAADDIKKGS